MIFRILMLVFCLVLFVGTFKSSVIAQEKTKIDWEFDIKEDSQGNPNGKVFLNVGKRRVLILKDAWWMFNVVDLKADRQDVPVKAITACSGWWAGSGVDMYVIRRKNQFVIYIRYLDEQTDVPRYERLKSIAVPK